MDSEISIGVNPITRTEVTLNPPVRVHSYEDLDRFREIWNHLCEYAWELGHVDLHEVSIGLRGMMPERKTPDPEQ